MLRIVTDITNIEIVYKNLFLYICVYSKKGVSNDS